MAQGGRVQRIRYLVTMSLDRYIAGANGEVDWIVTDPEVDFGAIANEFETLLAGRKTFETMVKARRTGMPGMQTIVASRTLEPRDYPGVRVIGENLEAALEEMRHTSGKDIWLFGGGSLFRSLAA
jgi:dihydrofolate reductase